MARTYASNNTRMHLHVYDRSSREAEHGELVDQFRLEKFEYPRSFESWINEFPQSGFPSQRSKGAEEEVGGREQVLSEIPGNDKVRD